MLPDFLFTGAGQALVLVALLCAAGLLARLLEGDFGRAFRHPPSIEVDARPPLREGLEAGVVELIAAAGLLRVSIEPVLSEQASDQTRADAASTGEVWTWLQACERLVAKDPTQAELADLAAQLRAALFSRVDLVIRLRHIADLLDAFDRSVRVSGTDAYRGVPAAVPRPIGSEVEDEDAQNSAPPNFDEVLRDTDSKLRGVARHYAQDPAAAEDLHQDIRLAVWRALPGFRGEASLRTYVLRIAHYCGARFRRRQQRHVELGEVSVPCDTEADLDLELLRSQLREAVGRLPEIHREALELQLAGWSYRQIGERLGVTESNASARVSRARKALEAMLA